MGVAAGAVGTLEARGTFHLRNWYGGCNMNENETKGHGKELKGKAKEVAGETTGNEKLEAEGEGDQLEGKAQKNVGKAQDALTSDRKDDKKA